MNNEIKYTFSDDLDKDTYDVYIDDLETTLNECFIDKGYRVGRMKAGHYNWLGDSFSSMILLDKDEDAYDFLEKIAEMQDNVIDCTIELEVDLNNKIIDGTIYSHDCPMGSSRHIKFMTVEQFFKDYLIGDLHTPLLQIVDELYSSDYLDYEDKRNAYKVCGEGLTKGETNKEEYDQVIDNIVKWTKDCISEDEIQDLSWIGYQQNIKEVGKD